MSRIQNILDKAEREGTAMRTSRLGGNVASPAPIAPTPVVPMPVTAAPVAPMTSAAVPVAIEIPTPPSVVEAPPIVPGSPAAHATPVFAGTAASAAPALADMIESYTTRLNPLLVAGLAPKSLAAEQYRQLRTRLAHAENAHAMRAVLVTSPQKGEGKSITAANLALTMAQELQRRVVIVEADLRKPSLQHLFGLPAGPGLAEFLVGAAELKDVMKFLPDHNLTVITAGTAPTNPAELLGSTAMRRLLDQLRSRFDRVILDTPPVLPLADVAVLAPMVDGALLVVRAGVTPKPAIENALRGFDSSRLIGIVLNESGQEDDYRYEATRH
jgi:capsular exopolysaccharide synthesis family protein